MQHHPNSLVMQLLIHIKFTRNAARDQALHHKLRFHRHNCLRVCVYLRKV